MTILSARKKKLDEDCATSGYDYRARGRFHCDRHGWDLRPLGPSKPPLFARQGQDTRHREEGDTILLSPSCLHHPQYVVCIDDQTHSTIPQQITSADSIPTGYQSRHPLDCSSLAR